MTGNVVCYMYAVVDASAPYVEAGPGVDGAAVETIEVGDLAAVVSSVDRSRFETLSQRTELDDLDALEQLARAHHRVVDAIARRTPVAPLRMASVLGDRADVVELLRVNRARFTRALERTRGREEWGVKAYATAIEPSKATDVGQSAGGPGTAYLARKRDQRDLSLRASRIREEHAQWLHALLAAHAVAATVYPPQHPRLSGCADPMALNAAYLVGTSQAAGLHAVAAEFESPYLRVELTGPWAPYSFAEVSEP